MDRTFHPVLGEIDINELCQIPDCHRGDDEEPVLTDFVTEIQKTKRVVSVPKDSAFITQLSSYPAQTDNS